MKILQISAFAGWGCTGRIVYGIDQALKEAGHESVVAWGRTNTCPEDVETVQIGNNLNPKIHGLYARLTDHAGFGSVSATKDFLKEVDRIKPDLIHLQIMHGYYIQLELLFEYIKEHEIPVVWTFHDGWAFTGHCPCFCYNSCDKWKTGCFDCERTKYHPVSWFIDDSKRNYERKKKAFTGVKNMTVVTPSNWFAGKVSESLFKEYPIRVIHNGINIEQFRPTEGNIRTRYHLDNQKIVLGVSSTWTKEKGIDDFVHLSQILPKEYKIVLVGLSKEQVEKLPNTIIKIEHTDSVEELATLYTAADVFVNATYEDNYPTCNLEAIACGTPVITYDTNGSVESVLESGMGQIVPVADVDGLKNAIEEITSEPEKYQTNQGLVLNQRICYQNYVRLYQEMLGLSRREE